MPEVQVSHDDIVSLRSRLEDFEAELSEPEHALLVTIFELAADAFHRDGPSAGSTVSRVSDQSVPVIVAVDEPLPSIPELFHRAFTPGALPDSVLLGVNIVGDRVTGGPVTD